MRVGILFDPYDRFCKTLEKYERVLDFNGITHERLYPSQVDLLNRIRGLDLFIYRWVHIDDHHQIAECILPVVEEMMGVHCYPDRKTSWHYDDKIRQHYLMESHGFPMIKSWVFWDRGSALEWIEEAEFPLVFKLRGGAGSTNVMLVKSRQHARRLIKKMFSDGIHSGFLPGTGNVRWKDFSLYKTVHRWGGNILRRMRREDASSFWQRHKNYALFQRFVPNNAFDTRITVIGGRAFAFRRWNRDQDFRSSGSGRIDYDMSKIDPIFVRTALEVSAVLGFQSMAYDFLYDTDGSPVFCEVSYTYVDEAVWRCPGYWDRDLRWHEGHYWPHYFHLMDALKLPNLKQPDMVP